MAFEGTNLIICRRCGYWFNQNDNDLSLEKEIEMHQQVEHKGYEIMLHVQGISDPAVLELREDI